MGKTLHDRKWRKRRDQQLKAHPLCALCLRMQKVVEATVADHITPHKGDPVLFAGPLQSLCKHCHDSYKQEVERTGRYKGCDVFGMPLDPRHPWNQTPGGSGSTG